jgi:crotonobetainyl-CoA:carnitine CoA-transferase CaiB-like acyl-CoA transferase
MPSQQTQSALSGLRVIDLTRVLSGPYCTQILADHGADVIKVEPPQGDETRTWGPPFQDETASYFIGVNRNKRGISLDLSTPEGRDTILALLENADVLIENYKTGTMEKWGLGYADVLHKRFPKLIYCRISGFGADGPLGGLPGYDAVVQAIAGLMSVNGERGGEPLRLGVPIVDLVTGLNAAIGVLMAVNERERSGLGQSIDVTLFNCGLSVLHPQMANFLLSKKVPVRVGNAHPNITPYDTFATATVSIFLAVGNDKQFKALCAILGCDALPSDPRFSSNAKRTENREALKHALAARFSAHDGQALVDRLMKSGVPCGPVLNLDAVVAHPHTQHSEMLVTMDDYSGTASPIKFSRTKATYRRKPPRLGEHNAEVLDVRGPSLRSE